MSPGPKPNKPMSTKKSGLTPLGMILSLILIVGVIALGLYVWQRPPSRPTHEPSASTPGPAKTTPSETAATDTPGDEKVGTVEALTEAPKLGPAAPYMPTDNVVVVE